MQLHSMNYFLCVVLFLLAAASHSVAAELIRATYDGYYDYAIVCQDKNWKERDTKLCGEKYSMEYFSPHSLVSLSFQFLSWQTIA